MAQVVTHFPFFMGGGFGNRLLLASYDYTSVENKGEKMYLDTGTIIAITIALGSSLMMLFILSFANIQLLQENRFLKGRLRAWRKSCEHHVEVPF